MFLPFLSKYPSQLNLQHGKGNLGTGKHDASSSGRQQPSDQQHPAHLMAGDQESGK